MRVPRQLHVRISARDDEALEAIAEERGTTKSALVRGLIRAVVERRVQAAADARSAPRGSSDRRD